MILVAITKKDPKVVQVVKCTRVFIKSMTKDVRIAVYKDIALTHTFKLSDLIDLQFVE